ncbi:F-box-like domain-containing protein [Purpureocillium lavendulum]|uniref:F-box-like domain-containing protein n=1 Tax=Purpureocillium lavendulum TaxID=1247861 RepID=A0AB34G1Q1_9HYPO|nr:F-box-like domain-containing protein [Purpureocillium lavendulum]
MRRPTPAAADQPESPPPSIPADPETPHGLLVAAIWAEDVDAVEHVLNRSPDLAGAKLRHYGLLHRAWLGEVKRKDGFFLRDRGLLAEPAVIFAAKVPFYKQLHRSTRAMSPASLAVLRLLVDRGASLPRSGPDAQRWMKYGLIESAGQYDCPEAMRLLIRAGVEVDLANAWGPLGLGDLALRQGAARTVDALLDLGAAYVPFAQGLPHGTLEGVPEPSVAAAESGQEDVVEVLLRRLDSSLLTRRISATHDNDLTVLDALLLAATDRLQPLDEADSPIVEGGPWLSQRPWVERQERLVHRLLDAGANPGAADSAGRTAFQCACRWAGAALIRRFAQSVSGGLDQQLPYIDWHDKASYALETIRTGEKVTYLHVAAGYHNAAAVRCLLEAGAQTLCDEHGRTPLHWCFLTRDDFVRTEMRDPASLMQHVRELYGLAQMEQQATPWSPPVDVVATLLNFIQDPSKTDSSGRSALHFAAQNRYWEAMAILVRRGLSPAMQDENGLTVFHFMVTAPKPPVGGAEHNAYMLGLELLREVLREQPDIGIDAVDADGLTALHQACELAHVLMVELFVTLGADPNCQDSAGWTPLCCAAGSQCQDRGETLERVPPNEATERRDKALYMKGLLLDAGADPALTTASGATVDDVEADMVTKLEDCVSSRASEHAVAMAQSEQRHVLPRCISPSPAAILDGAVILPMDPPLLALLQRREPGTLRWVFDDEGIRAWIDGSPDVPSLWLYGNDGSGKTVLMATLAHEMIRRADQTQDQGRHDAVCFFLCRDEGAGFSAQEVMATLLLQLAQQSEAAFRDLTVTLQSSNDDAQALKAKVVAKSTAELGLQLEAMARHFGRVSVLVAAIDGIGADARHEMVMSLRAASWARDVSVRIAVSGPSTAEYRELAIESGFRAIHAIGMAEDIRMESEWASRSTLSTRAMARMAPIYSHWEDVMTDCFSWLWAVCELDAQCNLARLGKWTPQPQDAPPDRPSQWQYGPDPVDVLPAVYPYGSYLESVLSEGNPRTSFILNRVLKYVLVAGLWQEARLSVEDMCETLTSLLNHNTSSAWYAENGLPSHRRHPAVTEGDVLRICGPLIVKARDGSRFDIAHPSVIGFFRFHNPTLPNTRDFLRVDSPARVMGETVDEFAAVAKILEARGLLDAAEAMHRRVVRCEETGCGPAHVSTLARLNNLADFLLDRGRLDEAEPVLLRVKAAYEAMDPPPTETPDRDSMYNTYNMLGILYKRRGEPDAAEAHYGLALSGREALYGAHSVEAARTAGNLGLLYATLGGASRADDAAALWARQATDLEAALGATHPDVVTAAHDLALLHKSHGRAADATPLMERAAEGYERLRGRTDTRTQDALYELGQLRAMQGDLRGAMALFREVVRGRERAYGRDDERTQDVREGLAMVQRDLYALGREDAEG